MNKETKNTQQIYVEYSNETRSVEFEYHLGGEIWYE